MIGIVISASAPTDRKVLIIRSADALGTGVVSPLPPIKYQSKPELLESTSQLYRVVPSPPQRMLCTLISSASEGLRP